VVAAAAVMAIAAGVVIVAMNLAGAPTNSADHIAIVGRTPSPSGSPNGTLAPATTTPSSSASAPTPIAVASASRPATAARRPSASPTPTPLLVAPGTQAQRVHELMLINQQRRGTDLPSLSSDAKLQSAAQDYAEHLALDGQLSHTDGSQPGERVTAAGYQWQAVGESLGLGNMTPSEILATWMASSDDRANILSSTFVDVGIGIATRPDGQIVWCIDFATPR